MTALRHAPALLAGFWGCAVGVALVAPVRSRPWLALAVLGAGVLFVALEARLGAELPPARASRGRALAVPAALAALVAAVAWPALDGDFLGDDFGYVQLFHAKPLASFLRLGDVSEGIWGQPLDELRPAFALFNKLRLLLHGPGPGALHASNLALHVAVCLALYGLVRTLVPGRRRTAVAAALVFGLMPVHVEPISWITGTVDSLPTLFYVACVWQFARFRRGRGPGAYAAALALYLAGVFTKEILVTLPATLLAFDLLLTDLSPGSWPDRARALARVHAPFVLTAASFLVLRRLVFASFAREGRVSLTLIGQFLAQQPERLRAMLAPTAEASLPGALAAAAGAGLLLAALAVVFRRRGQQAPALALLAFFGLAWHAVTVLPLLVTYVSLRHLYLPSCGLAVAVALLLFPAAASGGVRSSPLRVAVLALLLLGQAVLLRAALAEWNAAGRLSRSLREQIASAAGDLPPGGRLLLSGLPQGSGKLVVWKFALPFALQAPFVDQDVYAGRSVIEPPRVYGRPLASWWAARQPLLRAWLDGPADERLDLLVVHWNARRQELLAGQWRPSRALLRGQVARTLGSLPEAASPPDAVQAERLVASISDAVRQSPSD